MLRPLLALLCALPLLGMRSPLDSPWSSPMVELVPVTRFDSARVGVSSADLGDVIVSAEFADALPGIAHARPIVDRDPVERVRKTGEVALVRADRVTTAVKTLELDGRYYWSDADRLHWPLRAPVDRAHPSDGSDLAASWSLLAAGEMIFGRGVQERIETRFHGDARAAFVDVRAALTSADVAVATLEAPLSGGSNQWCDTCMRFVGNERYAAALADAGLDVVSLAANHIGDAGPKGVLDTMRVLDAANVAHVGAGADLARARLATSVTVHGLRVAFLAYNDVPPASYGATRQLPGSNLLRHDDPTYGAVRVDVARAALDADVVIVLAHWGIEYEDSPRANVVAAAHAMIEAGATAVIGDHPHWVQSVELYRGAYIAYGVGNFIFDQMWSDETREGSLHELWFAGTRLVAVRIHPTIIDDYFRPRVLDPSEAAFRAVLDRIQKHSSF